MILKLNRCLSCTIFRTILVSMTILACEPAASQGFSYSDESGVENVRLNLQATEIAQGYPAFFARYSGPNSLPASGMTRQTTTVTAALDVRMPWSGGEVYFNPEFFQGFGLASTLGIAGFANGDAQKGGTARGQFYVARAFFRQTFALGVETELREGDFNQLAGPVPTRRLTFTVGKFASPDIFQTSAYAGDPRRQFMNWSIWAPGAWDFAANAKGYTNGLAVELQWNPAWSVRYGLLTLPDEPNGDRLIVRPNNLSHVIEVGYQHALFGRPGVIKPFGYLSFGRMGRFQDALALSTATGLAPDDAIEATRRYGNRKYGFGVLVDQEIRDNLGAFARASWSDGRTENFAFTQIDRSIALGVSAKGEAWGMPGHSAGIALSLNGLSKPQRSFLAAGGTGIIIGDGGLNYSAERIVEAYYDLPLLRKNMFLGFNYHHVRNPAFNADRSGPVHVFGLRLHSRY